MFAAWGRFVYRHRRAVVLVSVLIAAGMGVFASRVSSVLSSGGWIDRGSESYAVAGRLAEQFGLSQTDIVIVYQGPPGSDARSAAFQDAIAQSVAGLDGDPRVAGILGYTQTGSDRFVSNDGTGAYVVVATRELDDATATAQTSSLESRIAAAPGLTLQVTGYDPSRRRRTSNPRRTSRRPSWSPCRSRS